METCPETSRSPRLILLELCRNPLFANSNCSLTLNQGTQHVALTPFMLQSLNLHRITCAPHSLQGLERPHTGMKGNLDPAKEPSPELPRHHSSGSPEVFDS